MLMGKIIGAGISLFVGCFMTFNTLWDMSYQKRFLSRDVTVTEGKIIEISKHGGGNDDGVWYTAKVEYRVKGEIYRISGTDRCLKKYLYVNPSVYHVGDTVDIAYRNDKTNDCIIIEDGIDKQGIFVALFGCVFIIAAISFLLF